MNIIIDNRKTDILYVDKENNHVAKNNEVIKFTANKNLSPIDIYVSIITGGINLNDVELNTLKYIINNNGNITIHKTCVDVANIVNKSIVTIARAINKLKAKGLVYTNSKNIIKTTSAIFNDSNNIKNAKFFIVEINPKITSSGIL